jgi:isochorismate pyruvate lyase
MMKTPDACMNMADLRAEIDALDCALVDLLAQRSRYIERAIALKPAEGLPARIEDRVTQVIDNARARAIHAGLSPELAEKLWTVMVDHFIAQEEEVLGKDKR